MNKKRVLVIEDDPMQIVILEDMLQKDYIVETATNGLEALEILPDFSPDVVLSDIVMPELDGLETCRIIRKDKRFNYIKIILVSGELSLEDRLNGYEAGADDYITKPFNANELLAKVKVFTKLKRSEEVDQIKSNMLSLLSHETKTPLNSILGLTELLAYNESLDDEAREYLGLIKSSGNELLTFINKTNQLCSLKIGKNSDLLISKVHFKENLNSILQTMENPKNIEFDINIQDDFVIEVDWVLMNQAIVYILENAIKFSKANQKFKVEASLDTNDYIIKISDCGKGISPEIMDYIFEPFAIMDIKHHHRGSGLSLAIAKEIIRSHKGSIMASNNSEGGATFEIRIPLKTSD